MGATRDERERYLLDTLTRQGALTVADAARDLGVSEVTIRTQLAQLEERGLLARTYGGARATSLHDVLAREQTHVDEKERIAAEAASLVRDGDHIMVEAGTTTARLMHHLADRRGVQIVTNSTLVLNHARHHLGLTVHLTGGTLHRPSESLIGAGAVRSLREFHVRLAFVGTDGFTLDHGLSTSFAEGAELVTCMSEQADETWLLSDSTKYGEAGFVHVLDIAQLAGIVTDTGLGDEAQRALTDAGPQVRVV